MDETAVLPRLRSEDRREDGKKMAEPRILRKTIYIPKATPKERRKQLARFRWQMEVRKVYAIMQRLMSYCEEGEEDDG